MDHNVASFRLFPGITDYSIKSFLSPPIKGIIMESYGCGNIPNAKGKIIALLKEASDRGVVIVNVSQCNKGNVVDLYETSKGLKEAGVVAGGDMTSEVEI
ncbi:60 kDa lysophospholipase [Smittium culicis]|uniref:asparaginase n=1 Tax=Smittium culicis TaxID=133412 RepID=A0A1R1YRH5_9FUNG|nr:60 kDa lysophospholipase [Smittium culicis]